MYGIITLNPFNVYNYCALVNKMKQDTKTCLWVTLFPENVLLVKLGFPQSSKVWTASPWTLRFLPHFFIFNLVILDISQILSPYTWKLHLLKGFETQGRPLSIRKYEVLKRVRVPTKFMVLEQPKLSLVGCLLAFGKFHLCCLGPSMWFVGLFV
jgi:hypothetical protein